MWQLGGQSFDSRLLLGTAQYPSLEVLQNAIVQSGTQIVTVSLCRQNPLGHSRGVQISDNPFWQQLQTLGCSILPNTAGCRNARDAVAMAEIAREIFQTNWIKLEVIGDDYTLQPDPFELLTAARQLLKLGFVVFPYCTEDLVLCRHLYDSGCQIIMPWAAPIGSGKGLLNPYGLDILRNRLPNATLIIDAGIGKPSQAAQVMELGFDGVLLNTAVALAQDPVQLAKAFRDAVSSGRSAYTGGAITERNCAHPSTALLDTPFWQQMDSVSIAKKTETVSEVAFCKNSNDQPPPIVWTIAGSDSGGGAGIQADLHTFQALGTHGCSVITAVTAQNSVAVGDIHDIPASTVLKQIALLAQDLPSRAIKIGLLGNREASEGIVRFLQNYSGQVVLDPVMIASSGNPLFAMDRSEHIQRLRELMSVSTIATPNLPEAEALVGHPIQSHEDMKNAAQVLLHSGVRSVLIKGGHFREDPFSQDYWTDGKDSFWLASERQVGHSYHGGGCTLSSAITATLALGYPLKDALVLAKMYYHQGIQGTLRIGAGPAPVRHTHWPKGAGHLPFLSLEPLQTMPAAFADCGSEPLGLYPVVDSVAWLERLLPLGVKTIQLRLKTDGNSVISDSIQRAIQIAKQYGARLFVNDHWELAIAYGAYGVHLGQEDLQTADLKRIHAAGLRLGISTHSYAELARAHTCRPSYIALGPIYPTTSKMMPFAPQGLSNLRRWRDLLNCPLVAIGGIQETQIPDLLNAGADGIAMISAITQAMDPEGVVRQMLTYFR